MRCTKSSISAQSTPIENTRVPSAELPYCSCTKIYTFWTPEEKPLEIQLEELGVVAAAASAFRSIWSSAARSNSLPDRNTSEIFVVL